MQNFYLSLTGRIEAACGGKGEDFLGGYRKESELSKEGMEQQAEKSMKEEKKRIKKFKCEVFNDGN